MRQIKFSIVYKNKVIGSERLVEIDSSIHWEWRSSDLDPDNGRERWYTGCYPFGYKYIRRQFTGLLDKYGKEIYEGDVIYNCNSFGCVTGWGGGEQDDNPTKKIIAWDNNDSRFKLDFVNPSYRGRGVSGYTLSKGNCDKLFEVIGNIYENPDLIKGQGDNVFCGKI